MTDFTPKHLEAMFGTLLRCCLHQPAWTPVDAEKVLCSIQDNYSTQWTDSKPPDLTDYATWKDGTESSSYTVARLRDGRYGLLAESEDFTGHGCQCQASAITYDSLSELLRMGVEEQAARDAIQARIAIQGTVETSPADAALRELGHVTCPDGTTLRVGVDHGEVALSIGRWLVCLPRQEREDFQRLFMAAEREAEAWAASHG